MDSILFHAALQ